VEVNAVSRQYEPRPELILTDFSIVLFDLSSQMRLVNGFNTDVCVCRAFGIDINDVEVTCLNEGSIIVLFIISGQDHHTLVNNLDAQIRDS